jgi:hypothetical protein
LTVAKRLYRNAICLFELHFAHAENSFPNVYGPVMAMMKAKIALFWDCCACEKTNEGGGGTLAVGCRPAKGPAHDG